MPSPVFLMTIIALAVGTINAEGTPEVTVVASSPLAANGSEVSVICRVRNSQMSTVTWYKVSPMGTPRLKLAEGLTVDAIYPKRYRINANASSAVNNEKEFRFVITNSSLEDSGNYTCSLTADGVVYNATAEVKIAVTPNLPEITYKKSSDGEVRSISNGEGVALKLDEVFELKCTVRGGYPKPVVNFTGSLLQRVPINNDSQPLTKPTAVSGLPKVTIEVNKWASGAKILPQDGVRQAITCAAASPLPSARTLNTTVYFSLYEYKPYVVCPPFVSSQLGSSGVILPCSVFADPLPASVTWAYDNAEGQLTSVQVAKGDLDRQSGPYAASYIVKEDGSAVTELRINGIVEQHMFTKYSVSTHNDHGDGDATLSLTDSSAAGSSVANHNQLSLVSVGTFLMAIVFSSVFLSW